MHLEGIHGSRQTEGFLHRSEAVDVVAVEQAALGSQQAHEQVTGGQTLEALQRPLAGARFALRPGDEVAALGVAQHHPDVHRVETGHEGVADDLENVVGPQVAQDSGLHSLLLRQAIGSALAAASL